MKIETALEFAKSHLNEFVGVDVAGPKGDITVVCIPPGIRVYILAGEYRHAEWFAHKIGLKRNQWRYVDEAYKLHGATGVVIYYETFWRHNHSKEIHNLAQILISKGRLVEVKQEQVLHE